MPKTKKAAATDTPAAATEAAPAAVSFTCSECGQVTELRDLFQKRWLAQMEKEKQPLFCSGCSDRRTQQSALDNQAWWAAFAARQKARAERKPSQSDLAEHEQGQLVAEFHAWVIAGRIEAARDLHNTRRHARELCILAGLAARRDSHPLVVQEFRECAADVIEKEMELEVFDGYYFEAANETCESWVDLSVPHAARLWDWFCDEKAKPEPDATPDATE